MDILFISLILNVDDKFGITIYEEQNASLPPCSRLLIRPTDNSYPSIEEEGKLIFFSNTAIRIPSTTSQNGWKPSRFLWRCILKNPHMKVWGHTPKPFRSLPTPAALCYDGKFRKWKWNGSAVCPCFGLKKSWVVPRSCCYGPRLQITKQEAAVLSWSDKHKYLLND